MNKKITNYVEGLFQGIPRSKKAMELKEELLANMNERFDDYIAEGKSEPQAYSMVISSLGDVDEMIQEVMPDADFVKEAHHYRTRNAKNIAISVAMYIIGAMFVVGFGAFGEWAGNEDFYGVVGVLILLLLVAAATGLIIYTNLSTPPEYRDYDEQTKKEQLLYQGREGQLLKSILSIYWSIVTVIYLAISFLTGAWHITWIIWLVGAVGAKIITTIYELRYPHE